MDQRNKGKAAVAVITRTKNRPLFLARAIKSVQNQSMSDFIQVIINDGGEAKVVDDIIKKNTISQGRIKVIHNEKSSGMEAASNLAIKSVDSEYVAIHDDDDSWHPDFLKLTTEHLQTTGAMGVVAATDRIIEEVSGNSIKRLSRERWHPEMHEISLYKQCLNNYAATIAFIYRRAALKQVGYYDEALPVAADWDFALRFLMHFDIDFLDNEPALAFYHHRPTAKGDHGNSVFREGNPHRHYINILANKYLRQDIKAGKFGLGYMISSLHYEQEKARELEAYIDKSVVRLEGHVNYCTEQLERHVDTIVRRWTVGGRLAGKLKRAK